MADVKTILRNSNSRIAMLALAIFALDQFTKLLVIRAFPGPYEQEKIIIPGFFKFVYWANKGAAWSLFNGHNGSLALIAIFALVALFLTRHHFDSHTFIGQIAFGLIFGGIAGNLFDRLVRHEVVDFIRFYMQLRGSRD